MSDRSLVADSARFSFGDAAPGAESPSFDDRHWQVVSLPHTWNAADATSRAFRRGTGWYRVRCRAPELGAGERVVLRFAGVSTLASVWLNGALLGTHDGGTSAFAFDATDAVRPGAENVLVVRADNAFHDDVPPREGDFTLCGGFYRRAEWIVTAAVAVDVLDHAGPGVYLSANAESGAVRARVRVRNSELAPRDVDVVVRVLDAEGREVAAERRAHRASPGVTEAVLELAVTAPRRWHGRRDPHLYRAIVAIDLASARLDEVAAPLGFRSFELDAERGFLLNGEPTELWGANLHQDAAGKGWAIEAADRERDLQLLVEMGASFVRLVHYQHDAHAYELADRLGLVVWAEHALVNTVSASPRFAERAELQLTELVRQGYNHPSIAFWGIGNEVQTQREPAARPLLERLAQLVKTEDPARHSALATCFDEPAGAYGVDLVAHNKYFGWYTGSVDDFGPWLDAQRAKNPDLALGMAEYGAGAGVRTHTDAPRALDHSEEHQSRFHEAHFRALRARPWVVCRSVWQLCDSASAGRDEGEAPGVNDKGLVTRDRATTKDAYHFYRAQLHPAPSVYIASRRFRERRSARTVVKVYSNLNAVALWLNGRAVGVRAVVDCVAEFELELAPGDNHVEVEARSDAARVRDACTWRLS